MIITEDTRSSWYQEIAAIVTVCFGPSRFSKLSFTLPGRDHALRNWDIRYLPCFFSLHVTLLTRRA